MERRPPPQPGLAAGTTRSLLTAFPLPPSTLPHHGPPCPGSFVPDRAHSMTALLFLKVTASFGLGTVRLSLSRVTRRVQGPHVTQAFRSPTEGSRACPR